MRLRRPLAGIAAVFALAGCSFAEEQSLLTTTSFVTVGSAPTSSTAPHTPSPAASAEPPGPDAPVDQVAAWVESAPEAAERGYRTSVDSRGEKHDLGDGALAFVSPSRKIACHGHSSGGLYCSVDFQNPLPKPPTAYGNWLPGIVMFSADGLSVGQGRGDPPSLFFLGNGPELPYGQKIAFGEADDHYVCRMEQSGLTCVDTGRGSAALINDSGVVPYGCLRESHDVGNSAKAYRC